LCSNGFASFTNSANSNYNGWQLPSRNEPTGLLAPYWTDLNPSDGGEMWWWTNGEDMAVFSWIEVPNYGADVIHTFQVILYDENKIKYQYMDDNGNAEGNSLSIGFSNPGGEDGLGIYWNENGGGTPAEYAIVIADQWIEFPDDAGIAIDHEAIDYGNVFVDDPVFMDVEILNIGGVELNISTIDVEGAGFAVDAEDDVVVASGETYTFTVGFSPAEPGEVNGVVSINSDAVNAEEGVTTIALTGVGIAPPDFSVAPVEVFDELVSGETAEHDITLTNDGEAELGWDIDIEVTGEQMDIEDGGPQRDPVEATFAVFQEGGAWGWLRDVLVGRVEGAELENFNQVKTINLGD
jgi:hypothetical protein